MRVRLEVALLSGPNSGSNKVIVPVDGGEHNEKP